MKTGLRIRFGGQVVSERKTYEAIIPQSVIQLSGGEKTQRKTHKSRIPWGPVC